MYCLLEGFGSWKNICDMRCQPVKHMQVIYCNYPNVLLYAPDNAPAEAKPVEVRVSL